MGAKTTSSLPFSFLPRLGFTPSHKTGSSSRSPYTEKPEEDWYIPYNGPLEPPKSVSMAKQDTTRHPVSQDDVNAFLVDSRLLDRYRDTSVNHAGPVGLGPSPAQTTGFPRTRVRSDLTRRTASSSSVIDPTRPHPRRRQASAPRLQIITRTSMDASVGVGESPMPMQRIAMSSPQRKMGRFFGFGSTKKPKRQSTSTPVSPIRTNIPEAWLPSSIQHSTLQDNVNFAKPSGSSPNTGNHFDTHYSTLPRSSHRSHTLHYPPRVDAVDLFPSKHRARHIDLHGIPDQDDSLPPSPTTNYNSPTIFTTHPYANTSSSVSVPALRPGTSPQYHQGHQQLDSGSHSTQFSHNPRRNRALTYAIDPRNHRAIALDKDTHPLASSLKPSVSTPNLLATSHGKQTKSLPPVAGFERWLSPETWCDALFFPRPRLKVRRIHEQYGGSSGRIVSPPITPIAEGAQPRLSPALLGGRPQVSAATPDALREHHVLLKSRSAVDILSGPSISGRPRAAHTPQQPDSDLIQDTSFKDPESVPRTSTAQQELRPSTSVPSLTQ
ncbi:hypothetical protein EDB19DRAFT_1641875 [Suillus lakei]|nr:hypothetical protein EDB19DRAFT_1641875 [Suillus lakei]